MIARKKSLSRRRLREVLRNNYQTREDTTPWRVGLFLAAVFVLCEGYLLYLWLYYTTIG